ncbi:S8 family serine peptidase [Paenisporosarcina sp.]|uniref:S8 family serine peptidase n=1 Tax=Paenisporosarcina sp. TaxID=1932001 RepID=UPI003C71B35F
MLQNPRSKKRRNMRLSMKGITSFLSILLVLSLISPISSSADADVKSKTSNESIIEMKRIIVQNQAFSKTEPQLHVDLQNLKGDQNVNVIVHFSEKPVTIAKGISLIKGQELSKSETNKVTDIVNNQQSQALDSIRERNISVDVGYSFNTVLNAVAMTVKSSKLQDLLKVEGVVLVEPDADRFASEPQVAVEESMETSLVNSTSRLDVDKLWNLNYYGETVKVGIIDTGIDYLHPEFEGIYKGGHNFVPHSSDYLTKRATDDPYETTPADRPLNKSIYGYQTSQGTRMAGIIAASGSNEFGIKGIAPKVELHAYRVLGAYGKGSASWLIAGIEKAVEEKMDIINLSASGTENDSTTADAIAINNAMLAGTLTVVGAGDTMGGTRVLSPGTAEMAITVGSSTLPTVSMTADVHVSVGDLVSQTNLSLLGWTYGKHPAEVLKEEFDLVGVPSAGRDTDYQGLNVEGKVVLVSTGGLSYEGKLAVAKSKGAIAIIVYNADSESKFPVSEYEYFGEDIKNIPTFSMSYSDGNPIGDALAKQNGKVSFSGIVTTEMYGNKVTWRSSIGPVGPLLDIKPDVVAPGQNIMSTIPAYGKDKQDTDYAAAYQMSNGTSISAAHVAGIAALLTQIHPEWTPFDVKLTIANTAVPMDLDIGHHSSVNKQGSGLVNAYRAAFPEALAYVKDALYASEKTIENPKGSLSFGEIYQQVYQTTSVSKQLVIKDLKGKADNYTVSVDINNTVSDPESSAEITVDKSSFTLDGEQILNVTVSVSPGSTLNYRQLLGYINITNGTTNISVPFIAQIRVKPRLVTSYSLDGLNVSFNEDGVSDSVNLNFRTTGLIGDYYIELWDVMNPEGGPYGDGSIGYLSIGTSLPENTYIDLPITGTYYDWETGNEMDIPDGLYTVDFTGFHKSDPNEYTQAWSGPLVVKETDPVITAKSSLVTKTANMQFKGQVIDKYLDYYKVRDLNGPFFGVKDLFYCEYKLKDPSGNYLQSNQITLTEEGTFTINDLVTVPGNNKLIVNVYDQAGNIGTKEFILVNETAGTQPPVTPVDPVPTPVPSPGPAPAPAPGPGKITFPIPTPVPGWINFGVDEKVIEAQVKDSTKKEVLVDVTGSSKTTSEANLEVSSVSLQAIAQSSKALVFITGFSKVIIPNEVIKQMDSVSPDSTIITVKKSPTKDMPNVISDSFGVSITTKKNSKATPLLSFLKPLQLTVPLNGAVNDSRKVAAYEVNSVDNTMKYAGGSLQENHVTIKVAHPAKFRVIENSKTFSDIRNYWAKDQIEVIASRTITSGKTDTLFNPEGKVTRAEFAVLIARALNLPTGQYEGTFKDVPATIEWAYAGIEAAYRAGIVNGKTKDTFSPDALITREEIAAIVVRAVKYQDAALLTDVDTSKSFADDKAIGEFAKASVKQAVGLGVITGRTGNKFDPKANATRAEAAVMLYRALDKLNEL